MMALLAAASYARAALIERELTAWAEGQRALARALGLSIDEWIRALEDASQRKTGLTAAVIGASMARGLGMSILDQLDPEALAARARTLIDPEPPRVDNPILAEAIRRAGESDGVPAGGGARRLKRKRLEVSTPKRGPSSLGSSASVATPDAPGREEEE